MSGEDRPLAEEAEQIYVQKALRESAILRELADILNSSLDLEKILQKLVKRTTELCNIKRCAIWLFEEAWSRFRPVTYHIATPFLSEQTRKTAEAIWQRSPLSTNNPVFHRLLAAGGLLYVEDLRAEPSVQTFAEKFLAHSTLLVALVREGRPVGMMSLDNPGQSNPFSQEQQELAWLIGQQATIAIDNARLYQHAQEQQLRAEHLIDRARAIYQVAKTVNSGEELPAVLRLATGHLVRSLEAHSGQVMLLEPRENILRPISQREKSLDDLPENNLMLQHLPNIHAAVLQGKPVLVSVEQAVEAELSWFDPLNLKNLLIVPLMGGARNKGSNGDLPKSTKDAQPAKSVEASSPEDFCLGLIAIHYTRRRKPTLGEYAFAQDIAAQCALAIEKAHLLTEARQAAELANERANTLNAVFQAMTEGITEITPDAQIFIHNAAAAHLLGVPVFSSTPLESFLQEHPAYNLDGQIIPYKEFPLTRALQGALPMRGERVMITRADGTKHVAEITATPLMDSNNQQIGLVSAFRDITVQTQAEQRIRQALETFLHIAEAISRSTDIREILYSVLTKMLFTLNCSRGSVYLFQPEQQIFSPIISLGFSPEQQERWLEEQQIWLDPEGGAHYGFATQLMAGYVTLIDTKHCLVQPNPFIHTNVLAAPIRHNEQMLGFILLDGSLPLTSLAQPQISTNFTNWDITIVEGIAQLAGMAMEQAHWQQEAIIARANEAAVRKADAMKDEFLAITSHEFRSPLAVILARSQGALRVLRRSTSENLSKISSTTEEHLEIIAAQAKQLNNIVVTFLDAARMNQGQLLLQTETVDLGAIAKQVVANQASLNERHTLRHVIRGARTLYLVTGDPARLAQVIANLVENAIKYSPLGGPISVILRRKRRGKAQVMIEVCVEDKGMGIPPEDQARVFERFYRVPNITETRGVGLGLYIVARLVQMHGGQIHVESSGIAGEGSRFIFTLPALIVPSVTSESENGIASAQNQRFFPLSGGSSSDLSNEN